MGERLQKLLAASGHGSRRQIEEWIRAGRVKVNGRVASLGERADAAADIQLDGRPLRHTHIAALRREVLIYHKPVSEVTTRSDPQGRPTVFERLPDPKAGRWIVIGRLDVNTTGLLLFTNDGELAHRMMHPSSEVQREYLVRVRGLPGAASLQQLREGLMLEDGLAKFISVEAAHAPDGQVGGNAAPVRNTTPGGNGTPGSSHSWFRVVLCEGRNREVRRLWRSAGFEVSRLMRIRYATVELPRDLRPGQWRRLPESQSELL
jgi:23S rRNA pseudouridine2605 synthase